MSSLYDEDRQNDSISDDEGISSRWNVPQVNVFGKNWDTVQSQFPSTGGDTGGSDLDFTDELSPEADLNHLNIAGYADVLPALDIDGDGDLTQSELLEAQTNSTLPEAARRRVDVLLQHYVIAKALHDDGFLWFNRKEGIGLADLTTMDQLAQRDLGLIEKAHVIRSQLFDHSPYSLALPALITAAGLLSRSPKIATVGSLYLLGTAAAIADPMRVGVAIDQLTADVRGAGEWT